jgi:ribose transport system substrate-binding protein
MCSTASLVCARTSWPPSRLQAQHQVGVAGRRGDGAGSGKQLTIGFVPGIASDPFFKAMQLGTEAKAKQLGIKLLWQGSPKEYSPQSQIPFVDAMLTQHVDGLVLVPTDPDAQQPSVTRAQTLKIPVVAVDTAVSDESYLTAAITGDSEDGGKQAAKTLAAQIGDSGQVFIMNSSPTATTNQLRSKGKKVVLPNVVFTAENLSPNAQYQYPAQ